MNQKLLNLIFKEFMKIIDQQKVEIAFEVYGTNKPLLYFSNTNLSKDKNNWIIRKRNVVDTFSKSSLEIAEKNNYDIEGFVYKYGYSQENFALVAGAVPIFNNNHDMIGILSVTGLQPIEDHNLACTVLENVLNQ